MTDNDGLDEALEGAIRLGLITAGRIGAELAAAYAEQLRQAQVRDEQTARRALARHEAERRVAVAELAPIYRRDWWENATPEQIGEAYTTAVAWAPESPEAAAAVERMQTEVRERHGIDVPELLRRAELERAARVEAAVQAAAQERAENPDRARGGFSYGYFDAQTDARSARSYTKEEALEVIAHTRKTITLTEAEKNASEWRGPYLHQWFGKDPDVDRAIADRLPHLIPARYFGTETDEAAAAEPGTGGSAGPARDEARQQAAAAAADASAERVAAALAVELGQESAMAITRSGAWPGLAAEMRAAEEAGHDVPTLVREITTEFGRDLDDAQDNASVLHWRTQRQLRDREPEQQPGATPAETDPVPASTPAAEEPQQEGNTAAEPAVPTGSTTTTRASEGTRREQFEADVLAGVAATEHAANQAPGPGWDSAERRQIEAAAMTDSGLDSEVVAVRMRADTAAAVPAAEATVGAGPGSTAPTASIDRGAEAVVEAVAER